MKRKDFVEPDDYFSNGIFEIGRFGNRVIMRNNSTPEEHKKIQAFNADSYSEKKAAIDERVKRIRNLIINSEPLLLLQYCRDMAMVNKISKYSETEYTADDNLTIWKLEYIQSVLVSSEIQGFTSDNEAEQEKHMSLILDETDELYNEFIHFYHYWSAFVQKKCAIEDDLVEFIVESQMLYGVRGKRYQIFQLESLKKLLPPHNEILVTQFKTNAQQIIEGLGKLENSLTMGRANAFSSLLKQFEEFQMQVENGIDPEQAIIASQDLVIPTLEKALGLALNDVSAVTTWDQELIRTLTYKLNECEDFYGDFEFSGWPILNLPVSRKPFIEINGVSYCFNYCCLFDNIYRVIQKEINKRCSVYAEKWNLFQAQASESMVEDVFKKLLPGAKTYRNNYYPKGNSLMSLIENDLLILYDDVLLIAEIKAGSFPQTPPIIDYKAHIQAYKTLIERADHQCDKTIQYIQSNSHVVFYTSDKQEKISFNNDSIREIFTFSITIDSFNEFAARAEKLSFLSLKNSTIAISYDDLLTYSEYFDSPMYFLHFLKQRKLATTVKQIALNDEFDHLGMYIKYNMYSITALKMPDVNRIIWHGYREEIDNYFCRLYVPKIAIDKPVQDIPPFIKEIIKVMETIGTPQRVYLSSFLLDLSDDARGIFVNGVRNIFDRQMQAKRTIPMLAFGESRYCVFININGIDDMDYKSRYDYVYATAMRNSERSITWLDLFVDKSCKVLTVDGKECWHSDINADDYDRLKMLSIEYAKSRVTTRKQHSPKHKIGRNEYCPCGSEKKYKYCCLLLE